MPKPPATPYFLFCKEKGANFQKERPDLTPCEVTKQLAEKWKLLGVKGKVRHSPTRFKRFNIFSAFLETILLVIT